VQKTSENGPKRAEKSINMPFTLSFSLFTFALTTLAKKTSVDPAQKPTVGFSSRHFQVTLHSKLVIFVRLICNFSCYLALGEPYRVGPCAAADFDGETAAGPQGGPRSGGWPHLRQRDQEGRALKPWPHLFLAQLRPAAASGHLAAALCPPLALSKRAGCGRAEG